MTGASTIVRRSATALAALLTLTAAGGAVLAQADGAAPVAYPDGYRAWTHVKTGLVSARHPQFQQSGGFRHIYANAGAVAGYGAGSFSDGSIIVVDWLEGRDQNGAFVEGARRRVDVMEKDSTRFAETGGWGFERFKGDSRTERTVTAAATQCLACHTSQAPDDLVISSYRD